VKHARCVDQTLLCEGTGSVRLPLVVFLTFLYLFFQTRQSKMLQCISCGSQPWPPVWLQSTLVLVFFFSSFFCFKWVAYQTDGLMTLEDLH